MNRRTFCFLPLSFALASCAKKVGVEPEPVPDISLTGGELDIAASASMQFAALERIVRNRGTSYRVGLPDEVVTFGFLQNDHRLRMARQNGEVVFLDVGVKRGSPTIPAIQFEDESGNLLTMRGQRMEFGFDRFGDQPNESRNWWEIAIKLVAIGFVIWLGASIAKFVVAVIAFLAFHAMVIGLIILALAAVAWVLEKFGWDFEIIKAFFQDLVERILDLLRAVELTIS